MPDYMPGAQVSRTSNAAEIFRSDKNWDFFLGVMDSSTSLDGSYTNYPYIIRAGTLVGLNATSKKFRPLARTAITASGGATSATITLVDAQFLQAGDVLTVGSNTGCVVTSVNYAANTALLSASITSVNSTVVKTTDGTGTAIGILVEDVILRDSYNAVAQDKPAKIAFCGFVYSGKVRGDLTSARADTGNMLSHFVFDSDYGLS